MNTPKIRFKGFEDDWEQRKVSDLLQERNEQAPRSEEYPLMAFIADQGVAPKGERYDRSALVNDENGKKYKRTEYGDFIYSSNNLETGSIGLNKYGNASISPVYSIFKRTSNVDLDFLGRRFLRKDFINEMVKWRQGVVYGQWKIHESDFLKINVVVPSIEEQKRIGHCFEKLDHLITLHQRKCDETKQLKKFMLQKMFPKNGEKNPEIRFEGFTDDWEQRKFSELYAKSSEKNDGSIGMDKNITVATMQFKEDVKVSTAEYLKTYYTFNFGDIAFEGHQSKEFRYGRFVENDIGNGIVSHIFAVFRPIREYDLHFWKYAINNEALMQQILSRSTKASTMMHDLVTNDFLNETFLVPSLDEQRRIGVFLDTLDNLITLHQRKCEKLKELKKFMLQNMFV